MTTTIIVCLILMLQMFTGYGDDSINLLVRSSNDSTIRRYCVELAKLPNGRTINVTSFGWHNPYIASSSVNACNITDLADSLPQTFSILTTLIIYEHQCKMTEHAWHVEKQYGKNISLLILTNRTNTHYELKFNTTDMPVSIPVLILVQKDFNKISKIYTNMSDIEISMNYAPVIPRKFRPATLLMFALVFIILLCGNHWAADEFMSKMRKNNPKTQNVPSNLNTIPTANEFQDSPAQETIIPKSTTNAHDDGDNRSLRNTEPPILHLSYCIIVFILCFAVGWLLLIFYFPKVMVYILQALFCIGAFSSLITCLTRLSYFAPILRRYHIQPQTFHKPCACKLSAINIFTLCAIILSLTTVVTWYVFRLADWAWILQDILGAAVCVTVISVYRLGNMRVITLILLGFFLYDIFFVFITPYISFFQPSHPKNASTTTTTTTTATTMKPLTSTITDITTTISSIISSNIHNLKASEKVSRNPSVMEQVALGIGADGEVVPLLFALPSFIPESEMDPCMANRKSMLGFGDIILPGILLTFCKIFDMAMDHRWSIYYIQSMISYFIGLSLTHIALYLMNTAQPALLYLVPCILLSTIITGICRGELRELYTGKRIQSLLEDKPKTSLLHSYDNSVEDQTNQSNDVVIGISDTVGTVNGVENQ
ncbi:unnamed protein product [Rotaria socialis]|uniref:Signal peptide peptidase-like 2B n=2 Tax=Rotaria socialis TaxID=392032 RepID=A0A818EKJ3_9BILA|nr:unnamed protein product [Rotaria socialis]